MRKNLSRELGWSPRDWSVVLSWSHGSELVVVAARGGRRPTEASGPPPCLRVMYSSPAQLQPCPSNVPRWTRSACRPSPLFSLLALCCSRRHHAVWSMVAGTSVRQCPSPVRVQVSSHVQARQRGPTTCGRDSRHRHARSSSEARPSTRTSSIDSALLSSHTLCILGELHSYC